MVTGWHDEKALELAIGQLRSQKDDLRNTRNQSGFAATANGLIATVFAGLVEFEKVSSFMLVWGLAIEFWLVVACFFGSFFVQQWQLQTKRQSFLK